MAADPEAERRALLKAATGRDLEEFVAPGGEQFKDIGLSGPSRDKMALVLQTRRGDGAARPFPHLTIPVDLSGAHPAPRADMAPHYTEIAQETPRDPRALKEVQTFVDLATGRPTQQVEKAGKQAWVRRDSLGDGGLPVFVQRENVGADGHSKKGRVGNPGALDPRRTRRLSDASQSRPASQIGGGFNAFAAPAEVPAALARPATPPAHAAAMPPVQQPQQRAASGAHMPPVDGKQ